jgi:hypothetical protein
VNVSGFRVLSHCNSLSAGLDLIYINILSDAFRSIYLLFCFDIAYILDKIIFVHFILFNGQLED